MQKLIAEKNEEIEHLWEHITALNEDREGLRKELEHLKRDHEKITSLYMDMSDLYFATSRRLSNYETADRMPRCVR